jgi:D-3-phosphoglycerate dehydrogenase / 2-oxoglutarate reductase
VAARPKVLLSAPYAMPVVEMYRQVLARAGCEVIVAQVRERLSEQELLGLIGDVDGMICGDDQVTARVLDAAPRLRVISKWGTGIDSIDSEAARARGVAVRNTPNAFSEPVADTVLGYVLLFARKLDLMDREIRAGRWLKPQLASLREKTLGVIGVGNCGKAVVRRAIAFGMRVLGHDIVEVSSNFVHSTGIEMTSRDELLRNSDFVSLNTTLNSTSRYLMNDDTFALMRSSAYLINTSRGPVVEEVALVRALSSRRIAGAALDVFEQEPLPANSPLRMSDNCLLAPHNANSSPGAADRVHRNTIRNLLDVLVPAAAPDF